MLGEGWCPLEAHCYCYPHLVVAIEEPALLMALSGRTVEELQMLHSFFLLDVGRRQADEKHSSMSPDRFPHPYDGAAHSAAHNRRVRSHRNLHPGI
jgi:hypothetical protein